MLYNFHSLLVPPALHELHKQVEASALLNQFMKYMAMNSLTWTYSTLIQRVVKAINSWFFLKTYAPAS